MDTNALMMPVERDVRVFDELERLLGTDASALDLVTPRAVVADLESLAAGRGEEGRPPAWVVTSRSAAGSRTRTNRTPTTPSSNWPRPTTTS